MLEILKARLRDERTWTVVHALFSIAIVWATMKLGASFGLHGSDLKTVLGVESTIAVALATMMHAPRKKTAKKASKTEDTADDADPDAQPSGDSGESDGGADA
jgi:hypothetical protein